MPAAGNSACTALAISDERQATITRLLDAPRELVWDAFTQERHFMKWMGPRVAETVACTIEPRVGGVIRWCMRIQGMGDHWTAGTFLEVKRPEQLVFRLWFTDADGKRIPHPAFADWPADLGLITTVTMEERGGKTLLTVNQRIDAERVPAAYAQERGMAMQGWRETIDRLEEYVPGMRAA